MSTNSNPKQPESENESLLANNLPLTQEEVGQIIAKTEYYKGSSSSTRVPLTSEEVRRIIAEFAYYKAEKRGFEPGKEEQDWIESEKDVITKIVKLGIDPTQIR